MGALQRAIGGSVGGAGSQLYRFGEDFVIALERILDEGCDGFEENEYCLKQVSLQARAVGSRF